MVTDFHSDVLSSSFVKVTIHLSFDPTLAYIAQCRASEGDFDYEQYLQIKGKWPKILLQVGFLTKIIVITGKCKINI